MTFFDWGCLFDLYLQPTSPTSTRLVLNGRVRMGFDIMNIAKRRGMTAIDMFINSMNLNNNQYKYGSY